MSIINDALKKVQNKMEKNSPNDPPSSANNEQPMRQNPFNPPNTPNPTFSPPQEEPTATTSNPYNPPPPTYNQGSQPNIPGQPSAQPAQKSTSPLSGVIVFLCLSFAVIGLLTYAFAPQYLKNPKTIRLPFKIAFPPKNFSHPAKPSQSTMFSKGVIKKLPSDHSADAVTVQGIMEMNGKRRALINDQIYEEGDSINGMTIVKIYSDRLEVLDKGITKTISAR